ncbi:MAG: hypothetical protein M1840_003634 [Geoglossum simile]|nr:MAG: hypothetical protein M1840_003634 [Geoglossum simile]
MLVNSHGALFIRGGSGKETEPGLWRDRVYQLPEKTLTWNKDICQSNATIPLFLSSTSVYLLFPLITTNPKIFETAIKALSLRDGQIRYKRKISDLSFWPRTSNSSSVPKLFKLLCLQDRDFIIDLSGNQSLSIIDGETGNVLQRIDRNGLGGYNAMPVPKAAAREFILWSAPLFIEEGNGEFARRIAQQTFTQQPGGTFVRTDVRTITYRRGAIFTVHPFGDYGFCIGVRGLSVLKIVPDDEGGRRRPLTEPQMGQQFCVSEAKVVSTRQPSGKMGKCQFSMNLFEENRPVVLLDQGRIVFDEITANNRTLHIVEFWSGR